MITILKRHCRNSYAGFIQMVGSTDSSEWWYHAEKSMEGMPADPCSLTRLKWGLKLDV